MSRVAEPEWDTATRDLALALDQVPTCGVCGRPAAVCQDPSLEYAWQVGDPVRCHATTRLREAQKGVTEETNPIASALVWPIGLRQPDDAAQAER